MATIPTRGARSKNNKEDMIKPRRQGPRGAASRRARGRGMFRVTRQWVQGDIQSQGGEKRASHHDDDDDESSDNKKSRVMCASLVTE